MSPPPATRAISSHIVSFELARKIVEQHAALVPSPQIETVELLPSLGRVLAESVAADRDLPPFPRSARDGYAVRAEDVAKVPSRLEVVGEIKAGDWPDPDVCAIKPGRAIGIMTGAPLPSGANAVVMVEHTEIVEDAVDVLRSVSVGENFVPRGAEARTGQLLLKRGQKLDHAGIAIAASIGRSQLQVFCKPRVAILSTGDELVAIDVIPGPAQIRNSNSYSLAAQVQHLGAEAVCLPIAPDEPRRLRELIEAGLQCDLLLMTGGVSMGKYDLVERVLADVKAEFYFTGAEIQPGRPVVFGSCSGNSSARVSEVAPVSGQSVIPEPSTKYFFRPARQSGLDHGHLRTLRTPHD